MKHGSKIGYILYLTAIPSLRDTVPHMEADVYTVSVLFKEDEDGIFSYAPAPAAIAQRASASVTAFIDCNYSEL